MMPMAVMGGICLLAAWVSWKDDRFRKKWLSPSSNPVVFRLLSWLFTGSVFLTGILAFLLRWYDPDLFLPYFERAWPFLAFVLLFSLQSAFLLTLLQVGLHKPPERNWRPALLAFSLLLLVYAFASLTRLGLIPDEAYWGEPGVPMQGWQLFFIILGSAAFLLFHMAPWFNNRPGRTEAITILSIYFLAVFIWLSVSNDVLRNSFYFPIDPPANTPFPYSDSGYYDYMAHSLLIGTDYTGQIPTRPLYILFLTGLHLLFGERYDLIIAGQTAVLAVFPVLLYGLGRKLHSRLAGLTIALLAIAREWTNLMVSSATRVSNTKTLLVDLPTLALVLLSCLLVMRWLKRKEAIGAFIAGGAFGLLLLLRSQTLLILPFLFLLVVLTYRGASRRWLAPSLFFLLGLSLAVGPWLTHNYLQSGKFTFDAPFQLQLLASQYAYTGNLDFSSVDLEGKGLFGILLTFALRDPGFVIGFITNHFLATEIGALLALPLVAPFKGMLAPINLYWTSFDGHLSWINQLLLIGYLAVIALGSGAAWRRWRWIGLLPLAYNLGYALANGIGRFSGWRYDLPADWIAYFYFGIGVAELLTWLAGFFGAGEGRFLSPDKTGAKGKRITIRPWASFALIFLLVGSAPWLAKSLSNAHFPEKSSDELITELISNPGLQEMGLSLQEAREFAHDPEAIAVQGRILYPRYFFRNSGLTSSTPWQSYAPRDYPRLGFLLINRNVREVVLPIRKEGIENVHAQDALILGCNRGAYIEARWVVFPRSDLEYLSNFKLSPCSAPISD